MVWHTGQVQGQRDIERKDSNSSGENMTTNGILKLNLFFFFTFS